jgi:RimJ/RimL family protein N-acetyltransferase
MRDVDEIRTQRLLLRAPRLSDAPRIARFCGDPAVGHNLATTPLPYLESAAEGWIMILAARAQAGRGLVLAVTLEGEGLIGVIGADQRANGAVEIGYWVGRPYWGQGFASEALGGFVREARKLGPLHAGHFVDNPASGRVLEKAGFAYTGETAAQFSLARGARVESRRMRFELADARAALDQTSAAPSRASSALSNKVSATASMCAFSAGRSIRA